jgi:hypothetical protein
VIVTHVPKEERRLGKTWQAAGFFMPAKRVALFTPLDLS